MLYEGETSAPLGRVLLAGLWLGRPPQRESASEDMRRGAGALSAASPLRMPGKQARWLRASAAVPGGCVTGRDLIAVICAWLHRGEASVTRPEGHNHPVQEFGKSTALLS